MDIQIILFSIAALIGIPITWIIFPMFVSEREEFVTSRWQQLKNRFMTSLFMPPLLAVGAYIILNKDTMEESTSPETISNSSENLEHDPFKESSAKTSPPIKARVFVVKKLDGGSLCKARWADISAEDGFTPVDEEYIYVRNLLKSEGSKHPLTLSKDGKFSVESKGAVKYFDEFKIISYDSDSRKTPQTAKKSSAEKTTSGKSSDVSSASNPSKSNSDELEKLKQKNLEYERQLATLKQSQTKTKPEPSSEIAAQQKATLSKVAGLESQIANVDAKTSSERDDRLASIEAEISSERKRWTDAWAVINKLTNNRRTPVKQGSPQYYRCLDAQKIIREVEAGAHALKKKKAQLE